MRAADQPLVDVHTQWHVLSVPKASFMCKCLIENPQLLHKYRGAHGTLRITAEVVSICDGVGGSDGSYTCEGISHDG